MLKSGLVFFHNLIQKKNEKEYFCHLLHIVFHDHERQYAKGDRNIPFHFFSELSYEKKLNQILT